MHLRSLLLSHALLLAALAPCAVHQVEAQTIVLGSASSFAVLGATEVTNIGSTVVIGDLGVSPGTVISGFPPGVVTGGTIHLNDQAAIDAHADATTAYNQLAALAFTQDLSGLNLGARTLTTGVYSFSSEANMTGTLTLDGGGQNALFVFQIGTSLTTAAASFNFINGATADNVWFQVGSSATLGTGTTFAGTIIANVSDTLNTGVTLDGRVFALTGSVTLDSNEITNVSSIPEPATTALLVSGMALLAVVGLRRRNKQAA